MRTLVSVTFCFFMRIETLVDTTVLVRLTTSVTGTVSVTKDTTVTELVDVWVCGRWCLVVVSVFVTVAIFNLCLVTVSVFVRVRTV